MFATRELEFVSLTYRQRYFLALIRTVSGSLSLICSSIIIYKIYLRYQLQKGAVSGSFRSVKNSKQGSNTYYRMLFMASVLDVLYSFWAALSVLPVPRETGGVFAYGNVATCSAQAFFIQACPAIVVYMATLNIYFMLKIRYNIPDAVIEQRYEGWLHAFPIGLWLTTGIAGLSLKVYGPVILPELGCWLGTYPPGCWYTETCTRGFRNPRENDIYAWTFSYMWQFLCFFIVVVNSILIYTAIRKQERRNEQYLAAKLQKENSYTTTTQGSSSNNLSITDCALPLPDFDFLEFSCTDETQDGDSTEQKEGVSEEVEEKQLTSLTEAVANSSVTPSPENRAATPALSSIKRHVQANAHRIKQSRTAAVQSTCYIMSVLFTAVWTFMPWVGYKLLLEVRVLYFFSFMTNIVVPSQGIFNLFIFVRLHYMHLRRTKKEWSRFRCIRDCLTCPA